MDLKAKPFHLNDEQIKWVEDTLASLSTREKVGQLFCINVVTEGVDDLVAELKKLDIQPGSYMTRSMPAKAVQENFRQLQAYAKLPLLLAANLERGADGVCDEGTCFGTQMEVAATNDLEMSYKSGLVCGREGAALGCNWNFGPILDIDTNFHNPITNTRVSSSDPEKVLEMNRAFIRGMKETGMAVSIKHWPGDGRDERDQHMVTSINSSTVEEWDATYGRIYRAMIEEGAETLMSAHIMLPAYSRKLRPGIKDEEILPGSLSYELNNDLLRGQLGFNGLIVSDATTMNGFMQTMSRDKAVPTCVANGCDVFLFVCNLEEDFSLMMDGLKNGILTEARLDEAVTRILALKASLGLPEKLAAGTMIPGPEALEIFRDETHRNWARECADKAVTLVKDTQHILPLDSKKYKRVLLHVLGDVGGYHDPTKDHAKRFIEQLEKRGFEITLFDGTKPDMQYIGTSVKSLKERFDLILYFANIKTSGSDTVARIRWEGPGALNSTRYIYDIPTVFVSVDNPYHLLDAPKVKTFINGYTPSPFVVDAVVEKLVGESEFKGVNPVDPFCGLWNARL